MRALAALPAMCLLVACSGAFEDARGDAHALPAPDPAIMSLYGQCQRGKAESCTTLGRGFERGEHAVPSLRPLQRLFHQVCQTRYPRDERACFAAALYGRGCDLGAAEGCAGWARLLQSGRVVTERRELHRARVTARRLWTRACKMQHGASCYELGSQLAARRARAAQRLFWRGCEAKHGASCYRVGQLFAEGRHVSLTRAVRAFERGCDSGHGGSCVRAGDMVGSGRGGARSLKAALTRYERACQAGDGSGCRKAGLAVELGWGVDADPLRAFELYRRGLGIHDKACARKDDDACVRLGTMLREGRGGDSDRSRGLALQKAACKRDSVAGCIAWIRRGRALVIADPQVDPLDVLIRACSTNHAAACFVLARAPSGFIRKHGKQLPSGNLYERACQGGHAASCNAAGAMRRDWDRVSEALFGRACKLGDAAGCFHQGLRLELPAEPHSMALAAGLYQRSCGWGFARACRRLGWMNEHGDGVVLDPTKGRALLRQACKTGLAIACHDAATLMVDLPLHAGERSQGGEFLRRACGLGWHPSCVRQGIRMANGLDGKPDVTAAHALFRASCSGGDPAACGELANLLRQAPAGIEKDEVEATKLYTSAAASLAQTCLSNSELCSETPVGQSRLRPGWIRVERADAFVATVQPECTATWARPCSAAKIAYVASCELGAATCRDGADFFRMMQKQGLPVSPSQRKKLEKGAFDRAKKACQNEDAQACWHLSVDYAKGRGVRKSDHQKRAHEKRACKLDKTFCKAG